MDLFFCGDEVLGQFGDFFLEASESFFLLSKFPTNKASNLICGKEEGRGFKFVKGREKEKC